ncbi:expressed unknown protein [Seminavis robusta]|uniref:Uncharacterized protein n=1 Tax=Seminavis robusta TaxID=568900 RepID=A0A9N8HR97_9STRA|nr:expressed unknown protein [Seminavis robusta]|eukprot:Sro1056_g236190.1 n/a (328) ;mRNA; f:28941-29924
MMKSYLSLLPLLLPILSLAADPPVIHECQLTYSVDLITTHEDDVVAECNSTHWEAITNAIHDIVELDVIGSLLGTSAPQFVAAYQALGDHALMTMLDLNTSLTEEQLLMHTEREDMLEDMYFTGCGFDDFECQGIDFDDTSGSGRRLEDVFNEVLELARNEREADIRADARLDAHQNRRLVERGLKDAHDDEDLELEAKATEWTPMGAAHQDEEHRRLGLDCGKLGDCKASWCCRICGHNCRRRLHEDAPALRGNTRDLESVVKRTYGQAKKGSKAEALIKKFERRVSRAIRKKLRRLARIDMAPCLGDFWELDVVFERHWFEEVDV